MYRVDVYLRVRRAVMVDGMSVREAAQVFGLHRDTVRKMLAYSVPPGYRRQTPPRRPKLEPYTGVIDRILEDDLGRPRKQRHTAKRIFEWLSVQRQLLLPVPSIILAGSPPVSDCAAGPLRCGSWGRRIPG